MASGQVVGIINNIMPPATSGAQPTVRAGGSTPAENVPLWAFDASSIEYLDYYCTLKNYASGGLTVELKWAAASATTGSVVWGAAVRRAADDAEDLDTSHTYDFNNASAAAAPSASGELSYDNVTFTDGADMDSLANNEAFVLRVRRDPTNGSDDMAGDAQLWPSIVIRET